MTRSTVLKVAGREVTITNPDKLVFPSSGHTKLDLVRYYLTVADGALRGIAGRPMILKRFVKGIGEEAFFQKRAPSARPDWIEVAELRYASGRSADEVVVRDAAQLAWVVNLGCVDLNPHPVLADDLTSASRYARKTRPGWERLEADLAAGRFDVLTLWEASRGSRKLVEWAALLDTCREAGVLIHIVGDDRTYDPRRTSDYAALASASVDAVRESDRLSDRSQRGINAAIREGHPPMGKVPYGYRRTRSSVRDEQGRLRTIVTQEPDPAAAAVVRGVFERCARGESLTKIAADVGWPRQRLLDRLRNPAYAGLRVHRRQGRHGDGRGQVHPGDWQPIVDLFWQVQHVLDVHQGAGMRPARQKHLLSGLAVDHRGHPLSVRADHYRCVRGCVQIGKDDLDELVEATILEALADPRVYRRLRQAGEQSSAEARAARNEQATLQARLDEYRQRARRGTIEADDFEPIAAGLRADIDAARARSERASMPPALRPFIEPGADVEARWDDAPLQAKRDVIRALASIVVRPTGRRRQPVAERVTIDPR